MYRYKHIRLEPISAGSVKGVNKMTIDEKEGLEKIVGKFEVVAEYATKDNIFDFVHFTTNGDEGLFNLSSWVEVEVNFEGLVQK